MKKCLKKFSALLLVVCTLVVSVCLVACSKEADGEVVKAEENLLVIRVTDAPEGATLKDVMEKMQADGEISFEQSGGMILSVNGKGTQGNSFWCLYTSDADFANSAWGSTELDGVTYDSATFGYERLPVFEGELYIWQIATW